MDIRDVVHGIIQIESHELPVIDSTVFQRLRQIRQTGFAEFSYPGATHNRYIHSLGALQTLTDAFEAIFPQLKKRNPQAWKKYRAVSRLAALLHDIGHGPLSHTTEFAMPEVSSLGVPYKRYSKNRKATHEDYTLKMLLDSDLTPILDQAGKSFGFTSLHVASLIDPEIEPKDSFFSEKIEGEKIDFSPILHQLVSSELDADRMDYLRRDGAQAGVSYGEFDYSWLVSNLCAHIKDHRCYLALKHRALYAFEDFLLSRYHMFLNVYLHHKTVVFDEMLAKYLHSPDCDYRLPPNIESYLHCTDAQLYSNLSQSSNPWAKRIVEQRPLRLLLETHSGIPSTENAKEQQEKLFKKTIELLKQKGIDYISTTSTGVLSKYFGKSEFPIYVKYDNLYSKPSFIPLQKCTILFSQYPNTRSISRIYVSPEDYPSVANLGRNEAVLFEV